jgi:ribosomal protein S18 acetylase RimI-like enzyme
METCPSYRLMKPGEENEVCELVSRVFNEFIAPGYAQEGVQEFLSYAQPEYLLSRSQQPNRFVLVALAREEIVGMIEVRDNSHISLLFVDREFQRRGIARELVWRALEICLNAEPDLSEVSVKSSPYAIEAYEKLGFRRDGPERIENGIRFTPMLKKIR